MLNSIQKVSGSMDLPVLAVIIVIVCLLKFKGAPLKAIIGASLLIGIGLMLFNTSLGINIIKFAIFAWFVSVAAGLFIKK